MGELVVGCGAVAVLVEADSPPTIVSGAADFCPKSAGLDTRRTARSLAKAFMCTPKLFLKSAEDYANSLPDTTQISPGAPFIAARDERDTTLPKAGAKPEGRSD
jgi:hypothetical protein